MPPLQETPKILFGLDLGKRRDFAVLVGSRVFLGPDPVWRPDPKKKPDEQEAQPLVRYYGCCFLKRWHLGTSYPAVVSQTKDILDQVPGEKALIVDANGVGGAVMDMLRLADMPCRVVGLITGSGYRVSIQPDGIHVPKMEVVNNLKALFSWQRLTIAKQMGGAQILYDELLAFQEKITKAGNKQAEAMEGYHDDAVMALALSTWYGENEPPGHDGPLILNAPWPPPNLPKPPPEPGTDLVPGSKDYLLAHGVDVDVDADWGDEGKPWWEFPPGGPPPY